MLAPPMADATTDRCLSVGLQQKAPFELDVSMQCKAGEMLALIGPSGSGKSTVLRSIAGLHKVHQGQVSCAGQIWLDTRRGINLSVQARTVGMVFQHYALFPHKTALENVALAVTAKSQEEKRKQAMAWLERTNMTGLENRKPAALSGGQRQRVALARALARRPSALLLDEPFSAVDQQTRRRLFRELAKLRIGLDIPIILVTHDMHEVQQLADSLCLIHKGRTLQQGSVQEVVGSPSSKSVAKLLGHQNLVAATVIDQLDEHTVYNVGDSETLYGPRISSVIGSTVTLLLAPSAILPLLEDTSRIGASNVLQGSIRDAVGMGDEWSLRVHLNNIEKSLRFRVPMHLAKAHTIEAGTAISISILTDGIHAIHD